MFLDEGPNDPEYVGWLHKDIFMQIVPSMLAYGKRKNKKFVERLHSALSVEKYPTLDEVFEGSTYSKNTINQLKSGLRQLIYFDHDKLTDTFFVEYIRQASKYYDLQKEMSVSKVDACILDSIKLNQLYSYREVFGLLKENPTISFEFPEGEEGSELDYTNQSVQYVQFNHVGVDTEVPYPIDYGFICDSCKATVRYEDFPKSYKCPLSGCNGKLKHDQLLDTNVVVRASQVTFNQKSLPTISIVEIPSGEFTAACLLCIDTKTNSYYIFILAIEEKQYETTQLDITSDEHAVWQLTEIIDNIHEERADYHIEGMDYYKAAILIAAVANASGFKSYNILIAGKSGGAKTATPRWYHNTFSRMCKLQDVVSVSLPGLIGSTATVTINGRNMQIREPGLLSKYDFVILDEIYNEVDDKLLSNLKGSLSSPTMSKEVHGHRAEVDKNASVVATANIKPIIYNKSRKKFMEYVQRYVESEESFVMMGDFAKQAYDELRFTNDPAMIVTRTMELECAANGTNWIDGQPLSDIERFALPFYVGNPSAEDDDSVPDYIFNDNDVKISTPELQKMVYTQEIRDYIQYCGQIKVTIDDEMEAKVRLFVAKVWKKDYIHSKARGMHYIVQTLKLSAMVCGRSYLNERDFSFTEQLFRRSCRWVEVKEMRRDSSEKVVEDYAHDRKEPVAQAIELFIDGRFKKYDLYGEGSSFWDRGIKNIACDIMSEFGVDDMVIANKHIENYVKKNGSSNAFDAYTLASNDHVETLYFSGNSNDVGPEDFREALFNEFAKRKEIPLSELKAFSIKCGVSVNVLNDHLQYMRRKKLIMNVGDLIKWL